MNLLTCTIIFICIGFIFGEKETDANDKIITETETNGKCEDKWKDCSQVMLYGDCFRFPHYAVRSCAKSCKKCK
ncbi:Uncharacterized protein BM_BM516 [Brugia malayi]|uniref:ShKT domain-containing protein n=1 Tax=Brugia malayi TaxID=6279 RepID=A0A4E9FIY9_BRUMA|nr:Uncharacterized protein BM_BM516 [Brugia malayi]VIO96951.1 Uncharacterized protein BM_BM516 [Brugia malayi]